MPLRTLSRHATSQGEVVYLRQPDGRVLVVLNGDVVAVAGPSRIDRDAPTGLRARIGFRVLRAGLHLLDDGSEMAA